MTIQQRIGTFGQNIAAKYLRDKGYYVDAENFHVFGGEIDLIARDPKSNYTVFVEVKTLTNNTKANPEEQITYKKMQALFYTAGEYARLHRVGRWRLDVIAITWDQKNRRAAVKHWIDVSEEDFGR